MKTTRLLPIAILVVAAIISIVVLLKKRGDRDDDSALLKALIDKNRSKLNREIIELGTKTWSDSSWKTEYQPIRNEIAEFLQYDKKDGKADVQSLYKSLDESYKLVLEKGAEAAIRNCQTQVSVFAQLQNEMDYFLKNGSDRFKNLDAHIKNYKESLTIISIADSLQNRPIENPYPMEEANSCLNKAIELRKDEQIMLCPTIQDCLDLEKLKKVLCDSHYEFLSKKVSGFLKTGFETEATKQEAIKTANSIFDEIKDYDNVPWYVKKQKTEKLTSALKKFITISEKKSTRPT